MASQRGGTRMDTIVKLVLIFFISLLSFAVGTFVGQGVSESEFREAALERGDYNAFRGTASAEADQKGEKGLTDEDIASLTEEFVSTEKKKMAKEDKGHDKPEAKHVKAKVTPDGYKKVTSKKSDHHPKEKVAAMKKTMAPTAKQAEAKAVAKHKAPSKEATRVAQGKAPMKDHLSKRKPTSVLPGLASSTVGKYTIQVASYPSEKEARSHASKLEGQGYEAFYLPAAVKGKTWFRVSVGLYSNHKSAANARKQLIKEGRVAAAIVQKIVK